MRVCAGAVVRSQWVRLDVEELQLAQDRTIERPLVLAPLGPQPWGLGKAGIGTAVNSTWLRDRGGEKKRNTPRTSRLWSEKCHIIPTRGDKKPPPWFWKKPK